MPAAMGPSVVTPGLSSYLRSLKTSSVESSIEQLISLLKRRQIRNSRPCAIATAMLLRRVVVERNWKDVEELLQRVRTVGQRLIAAQPREMVVGNIVRRVLGLVREVAEDNDAETNAMSEVGGPTHQPGHHDSLQRPGLSSSISNFSPLKHGAAQPTDSALLPTDGLTELTDHAHAHRPLLSSIHSSYATATPPMVGSLFGIFSHPDHPSGSASPTPGHQSPDLKGALTRKALASLGMSDPSRLDLRAEVVEGIRELLDELNQADDQIASYALDHIHNNEVILTHTASATVQNFLLAASKKRKFTVVLAEAYPNEHLATHAIALYGKREDGDAEGEGEEQRLRPLRDAGIEVVVIPDNLIFGIMSRVHKVILATHTVLANGGLVAASGASTIAKAARAHRTPVVVLTPVYKLSPVYPFDTEELIEYGDAGKVMRYSDGELVESVDVVNALYDYVPADLLDLYITNLGGHPPTYLYRIVADHYRVEDINF